DRRSRARVDRKEGSRRPRKALRADPRRCAAARRLLAAPILIEPRRPRWSPLERTERARLSDRTAGLMGSDRRAARSRAHSVADGARGRCAALRLLHRERSHLPLRAVLRSDLSLDVAPHCAAPPRAGSDPLSLGPRARADPARRRLPRRSSQTKSALRRAVL